MANTLHIYGNTGYDILRFQLFIDDYNNFLYLTDQLRNADPAAGSIYNPQNADSYVWQDFEELSPEFVYTGGATVTPTPTSPPPECPDGTTGNDTISCDSAPEYTGDNDAVELYAGDDLLLINPSSYGGNDNLLPMDGGEGHDTLSFELGFWLYSDYLYVKEILRTADPANGSFLNPRNGQTYSWYDFEAFIDELYYHGTTPTYTPTATATWYPSDTPEPATNTPTPTSTWYPSSTPGPVTNTPTLTPTSTPADTGFPALERYYPANGQTITGVDTWPRFQFEALTGVTWYQVWIGSDDYSQVVHADWHEASAICSDGVCTIPVDIWLADGDYSWWMTYWGPQYNSFGTYWHETSFAVSISAPPLPANLTVPDTSASNPAFTWDHSANALWYHVILAPADFAWVYDMGWHQAADLNCSSGTCTYLEPVLAGLLPADDYVFYVMAWGPGGSSTGGTFGYGEGSFSYAP